MAPDVIYADTCIAGAGVIGLAVARALAQVTSTSGRKRTVYVLEQHHHLGEHSSSRNSEVIHAGLYYPPASLKARFCLRGRDMLYDYCRTNNIEHHKIGKLVVAQLHELQALERLHANAVSSGVNKADLQWLDRQQVSELEPQVTAEAAILSRQTGIINSHQFLQSLLQQATDAGADVVPGTRVGQISPSEKYIDVAVQSGSGQSRSASILRCRQFINCGGLWASDIARRIEGSPIDSIPETMLVKGNYFSYMGKSPFSHLIYPLPEENAQGLGIHATLDLNARLRFGPDTEPVTQINYAVDASRRSQFERAVKLYFPSLDGRRLQPDYAGIRSRVAHGDFIIADGRGHGMPGLIQLFGIDSPGLTASLALADAVRDKLC